MSKTLNVTGVDKKAFNAPKAVDPRAVKSPVSGGTVSVWTGATVKR